MVYVPNLTGHMNTSSVGVSPPVMVHDLPKREFVIPKREFVILKDDFSSKDYLSYCFRSYGTTV